MNLLIVFGGTREEDYQGIFDSKDLDNTKVLQFNFCTEKSNIIVDGLKWMERGYQKFWSDSDPKISDNKDAQKIKTSLNSAGRTLSDVNWGSKSNPNTSGTSTGLIYKDYKPYLQAINNVLEEYHSKIEENYEQVMVLAHSRGCLLAIGTLGTVQSLYGNKLKRMVLLDPVSVSDPPFVSGYPTLDANIQAFQDMVKKTTNLEYHIIVRSKNDKFNDLLPDIFSYYSYAPDLLLGLKGTGTLGNSYHYRYNETIAVNMDDVYVHIAEMGHEGMLTKKLRTGFGAYMNIISTEPWRTMYSGGDEIDTAGIISNSSSLQHYVESHSDIYADEINPPANDVSLYPYYKLIMEQEDGANIQRPRFIAFLQCLASRKTRHT